MSRVTATTIVLLKRSCAAIFVLLCACASSPYSNENSRAEIDGPRYPELKQQVLIGKPNRVLDASGWYWPISLLRKLMLWNQQVDDNKIDAKTLANLEQYLSYNQLDHVQVIVNGYYPGNQWQRLNANKNVGFLWRYSIGAISTLAYTILPGRIIGGDSYNPFTDTIHLYSNDVSIAIHEAGHAKDFASRRFKGTHGALYQLPFAALYYEAVATSDALSYTQAELDSVEQREAYKTLYPAYSSYVATNMMRYSNLPVKLLFIIPGHIAGNIAARKSVREPASAPGQHPQTYP